MIHTQTQPGIYAQPYCHKIHRLKCAIWSFLICNYRLYYCCWQVGYEGDPEAALVSFASHAQAMAAYRCSEPIFNNRFIKIFWHNADQSSNAGQTQLITTSAEVY